MTFSFINSAFLFLLPLLAVPLLLHLFARSRPPVRPFPSIDFLRRVQRNTMRVRKPRDYLLLILRTLLFLALLGLFLRPVLHLPGTARSKNERVICLVVDATASMGVTENGQTRLAQACAETTETLQQLKPNDRVNLIWMRAEPDAVFPEAGSNIKVILDVLRSAEPGYEACDPVMVLDYAADMLSRETDAAKSLYIISDFQHDVWQHVNWTPPGGIEVVVLPVGSKSIPNTALADVSCQPAQPLPGRPVSLTATVANHGNRPVQQTVYLSYGSLRQTRTVSLPADSRVPVAFQIDPPEDGLRPLACSIADDLFPADNTRQTLIPAAQPLRVGLYGEDTEMVQIWNRILKALEWVEPIPIADLTVAPACDILLLAGWNDETTDTILDFNEGGRPVIWYPDTPLDPKIFNELLGIEQSSALQFVPLRAEQKLKILQPEDNLFHLFREGLHGDPTRARFNHRFNISTQTPPDQVLLSYEDGPPALMQADGRPFYLWNMPMDRAYSNCRMMEEFFILFAELLQRDLNATGSSFMPIYPGGMLQWTPETPFAEEDITLRNEAGENTAFSRDASQQGFISVPVTQPGVYSWHFKDNLMHRQCVVFPDIESDLTTSSPDGLLGQNSVVLEDGLTVRRLREGIELWPWLLGAVLMLALAELAAAWYAEKAV